MQIQILTVIIYGALLRARYFTFNAGSWQDTAGNKPAAHSRSFTIIEQTAAADPSKYLYFELSGGMNKRFRALSEPLLELEQGSFRIDYIRKVFTWIFRTIKVYKIGNIAFSSRPLLFWTTARR